MATNSDRQSQTDEVPLGMAHPTVVPENHEPESGSSGGSGEPPEDATRITRGRIEFRGTPDAFVDLVEETLDESRYIETRRVDDSTVEIDEVMVE